MSHRIMGCTRSEGTYGGGGGGAFNELPDDCNAKIDTITIFSGGYIDGIEIEYLLSNGQKYRGGLHGKTGGGRRVIDLDAQGGEYIIAIFGRRGEKLDRLGFVTNRGRVFGDYGGLGGSFFHVNACHVRGIFGRSGDYIDAIGFHCTGV